MFSKEPLFYPEIIVTIGPSLTSEESFKEILLAGAHTFRINMSHGDYPEHRQKVDTLRKVAKLLDIQVTIFLDLSGPKIRIKEVEKGVVLKKDDFITFTSDEVTGTKERVTISYEGLSKDVSPGVTILLDDGRIVLTVIDAIGSEVRCKVVVGGELLSHKGVNVPDANLSFSALTEKDKSDIFFGLALPVDAVALSFVRSKEDVKELRELLSSLRFAHIPIISKVETAKALLNLKDIVQASDSIMVARGDLGVEVDMTTIPLYQKEMCHVARSMRKPVIVATQMLESMVENPFPTRAEVSDAANAVLDGASYLMLSDETTIGKYPAQAVRILSATIKETMKGKK